MKREPRVLCEAAERGTAEGVECPCWRGGNAAAVASLRVVSAGEKSARLMTERAQGPGHDQALVCVAARQQLRGSTAFARYRRASIGDAFCFAGVLAG